MEPASRPFHKLAPKRIPKPSKSHGDETRYWSRLKHPVYARHTAAVTHVAFNPVAPHTLAATASTAVVLYQPRSSEEKKRISRFKEHAYSGVFRADGMLLAAGSESGMVQVFELGSRAILRQYRAKNGGHAKAVQAVAWAPMQDRTPSTLATGSDDSTVRLWDITEQDKPTSIFEGHTDYVRSVTALSSSHLFSSGSYDHSVRCWDSRTGGSVMEMDHGHPVEALVSYHNGAVIVSAGGQWIKVWDVSGGGKLLHSFSNHQKAITSLCFDGTSGRLLSGSLDSFVKIYDVQSYNVTYSLKMSAPVMSVAMAPDNKCLAVGLADGTLAIRHRPESRPDQKPKRSARAGSFGYQMRGKNSQPEKGDLVVATVGKPKLRPYDKLLKSFQFQAATDEVLATRDPVVIMSLLEALAARNVLPIALAGRDESKLAPLLEFVMRHITNPHYSALLIDVANTVLDIYAPILGQSQAIDELFVKLQVKVTAELKLQCELQSLGGMLQMILASMPKQADVMDDLVSDEEDEEMGQDPADS
eukprot:TRINITY_DN15183_c0_g1_i2.p1 TRINITY_DN15183_c0_g1~~TRINITY_DN15183_c0_g1_i2.p1  ORF type:complete len:530 (-),score=100.77 TRINITY_DN15183_c0_g1_i2:220-1809(-)